MRLTKKVERTPIYDCDYESKVEEKGLLDKLGQLEDIEEEKGLPLPVYIKLLESEYLGAEEVEVWVIYKEDDDNIEKHHKEINKRFINSVDFDEKTVDFQGYQEWTYDVPFSKYGVTWALTKEELE